MIRRFSIVLTMILAAMMFAGCASQNAASAGTTIAYEATNAAAPATTPSASPSAPTAKTGSNTGKEITVYAAASFTDPFNEIAQAFLPKNVRLKLHRYE